MKRFALIKKASPVNYALESTRTLDNGVVLRLIHCGDTLTVTAAYEKQLESFTDLRSVEEAAYTLLNALPLLIFPFFVTLNLFFAPELVLILYFFMDIILLFYFLGAGAITICMLLPSSFAAFSITPPSIASPKRVITSIPRFV